MLALGRSGITDASHTRNPKRTAATASALMIGVALVAFITVFAASARTSVATSIDKAMKSQWIVDTQFGMHEVAVQADEAKTNHVKLGDTVKLNFAETGVQHLKVVAIYGTKDPLGAYAISLQAFDANVAAHVDNAVLVANAPGVSMSQARHAIDGVLKAYPNATLRTKEEFKGSIANEINKILNLVYVLLAMALVIALFGIANTLALSVFERTREFGLLRAVGMSRAQVRSTVRALHGNGINQLSIPVQELSVIVALAALAAVVAAALPARRAARLDVLKAISD